MIKKLLRSALRILLATTAVVVMAVLGLWIALTQPGFGSNPYRDGARASPEALRRHVEFLARDVLPRSHRYPENLNRAAKYIGDALRATGAEVSEQSYQVQGKQYLNIVARLGGKSGPSVIVGAHYDAFGEFPGADDNASGTAGLLELARVLAAREVTTPVEIVAYSTEEPPYFGSSEMGSAVHAAHLRETGASVKAMICLEMIGYYTAVQPAHVFLLRLLYPRKGDFVLIAGRWQDRPLISEVKRSFRGASTLPVRSYCGPTRFGTDLSDQRNYWANDFPAVMVTDTAFMRNPNYHTSADKAETLDYDRMADVVDGVANAVINLEHAQIGN